MTVTPHQLFIWTNSLSLTGHWPMISISGAFTATFIATKCNKATKKYTPMHEFSEGNWARILSNTTYLSCQIFLFLSARTFLLWWTRVDLVFSFWARFRMTSALWPWPLTPPLTSRFWPCWPLPRPCWPADGHNVEHCVPWSRLGLPQSCPVGLCCDLETASDHDFHHPIPDKQAHLFHVQLERQTSIRLI